ncbi:MAG TPA: sugar phosphate isomerase/epimerase, partial [Chryseolinea sp.]|nr:sugar phosphate isomerase/epimerase [Chryseolinea sp.]
MKIIYALIILLFVFEKSAIAQEIGLQLYSLREQFKKDVPGTLQQINKWGIKEIEGGGTYGLPLEEYKKMLADNKLTMVSVGADYEMLKNNPQAAVDEAKKFNAKY